MLNPENGRIREPETCETYNPEIYNRLSEKQRAAVTHGEGPMLVTAGPGSGKTHVLTSRILYLIQERQVLPGQILVITFTREAAGSMQSRYLEMEEKFGCCASKYALTQYRRRAGVWLGQTPDMQEQGKFHVSTGRSVDGRSGRVSFATFHSFFFQILKSSEKYTNYRIISDTDRQKLIYPLLREIKIRQGETGLYYDPVSREEICRVLSAISYGKNAGRGAEVGKRLPESWRSCCDEILQGYEKQKEQRRQLDLDDLLMLTVRELERDRELLQYWRRRYTYVLVDEFQDCNPVQYEIIKMLYTEKGNIFAVGDDDQAIYGFRGADPGIMQRFREEYAAPVHVVLGRNYRCAPEIVDASAKVIACNRQRVPKQLTSGRETVGSVLLKGFQGGVEERRYVLEQCRGKTSRELDRFAVLFRTNSLMGVFGAQLMQAGIPFVTREKIGSVYEHFVVRDVMDYFRAAYGCRERQLFLRIWNRPRLRVGRESLDSPVVDFGRVKRFYSEAPYKDPAAVRDVEQFERKLARLRRFSLELGVTFIRRGFGYEDYLRRRAGSNRELLENWLEVLDWLEEDSRGYETFEKWERCQEQAAVRLSQADNERSLQSGGKNARNDRTTPKKGIHILTMHAAKGLEYDRVFLMDVNEGNIPKFKRGESVTEALLEEERRLLYVGMTRARDRLEILYQTGTKERPRLPSAFLQPLLEGRKE